MPKCIVRDEDKDDDEEEEGKKAAGFIIALPLAEAA